ncbi:MAG: tRNA (adenosine(37)-N6)-threonylcarbamoyltransferase complex dimerization subunit type 1 TsaB [Oscillospiraceae bacterium]|nr:tRNA (adenosine(37)-N6)-threonylcarbamoyltransferase complex dimerization subunit type 1 TsaB [Oscillospiraceae bacterium]
MRILALDASAKAASAAVCEDEKCVALYYQNSAPVHSVTLLPMAEEMLGGCGLSLSDIDLIAVSRGPGSFTGLRIAAAAAKGLMWGADKPGCGVSTLEAMAWQAAHMKGSLICCVMDARRGEVYNALFRADGARPLRLCPDRALSLDALLDETDEPLLLIGDGAELCAAEMTRRGRAFTLAPENIRHQNAYGVAMAALHVPEDRRESTDPVYLRLSQAERERNARLAAEKNNSRK